MATAEPASAVRAPRWQALDWNILVLAVFALIVPFFLGSSATIFEDGDVSWHVAAGRWMIEHLQVPLTDPFSFSAYGQRWIAHEWLGEVFMGAAYNLAGFTGLALLVVLAISALMLILWLELTRWLRPFETAAVLAAVIVVLIPFLLARWAWPRGR